METGDWRLEQRVERKVIIFRVLICNCFVVNLLDRICSLSLLPGSFLKFWGPAPFHLGGPKGRAGPVYTQSGWGRLMVVGKTDTGQDESMRAIESRQICAEATVLHN